MSGCGALGHKRQVRSDGITGQSIHVSSAAATMHEVTPNRINHLLWQNSRPARVTSGFTVFNKRG
jgi:hypothetical protein